MNDESSQRREIKSYVIRGGRLTSAQQHAMDTLWEKYGLSREAGVVNRQQVFDRQAELVLEIGFGMGGSLVTMANEHPERDYIGIDVHPPGIGTILRDIASSGLTNLKVYEDDALLVLKECIASEGLDKVQIYFPDPWHKKRHHKRRMIQPAFAQLLREKLSVGGQVHFATDWENYAEHILEVMEGAEGFENIVGEENFVTEHDRPETKFERRGQRLGHGVWDMIYRKTC